VSNDDGNRQRAPSDDGKGDCQNLMVFTMARCPRPDTPTESQINPKHRLARKQAKN
jgi:hypothetical protein